MVKQHLKRIFSPRTWPIKKKTRVFVTRPNPGAHKYNNGISINTFFKELLKYCKTTKEVKQILNNKEILVDGKIRKDYRHIVGLMDVVAIPETKEYFRLIINEKGKISYVKVDQNDALIKVCKINNKKILKKGLFQINFTDGRNMIVKKNDYKTNDSLVLDLPKQNVKEHLKFEVGCKILLIGGKHIGKVAELTEIEDSKIFFVSDKKKYETSKRHAFVIGNKKFELKLE